MTALVDKIFYHFTALCPVIYNNLPFCWCIVVLVMALLLRPL